jgi:hypothetical protein
LLGWLPGLSVGSKFFLGLRHNQRRGLRVRGRAPKLHRGQSGGGKQQQTKFCHDGQDPRKILAGGLGAGRLGSEGLGNEGLGNEGFGNKILGNKACHQDVAINEQALGRIVAGFEGGFVFICEGAKFRCSFVHYAFRGSFQTVLSHWPLGPLRHIRIAGTRIRSRAWHANVSGIGCR